MLDSIKLLLGIKDTKKDELIGLYVNRATLVIKNYLNNEKYDDLYIIENFDDAIIYLVENLYISKGKDNIKSQTQGNRSVTYSDTSSIEITDGVKNLLPTPSIRMR